ncbi:MAG: type II secretion system F family protein [Verrucomicrobiae bacterium]|nr:type II secretion system F family protein [Verrucomicrobiae bacterium]
MTTYLYRGVDARGRTRSGRMTVSDESALEDRLHADGIWLLQARTAPARDGARARGARVNRRELVQFCALLEFLTRVGIPIAQALDLAAQDTGRAAWSRLYADLRRDVEAGLPLADAMERQPRVFRPAMAQLIRAGEASGSVAEAFAESRRHLEWQEQVAGELRQATAYPLTVLVVAAMFIAVIFTLVVPKFVALLAVAKAPLPWPTRAVFGLSDAARAWGPLALAVAAPLGIAGVWLHGHHGGFAAGCERLALRIPLWGDLFQGLLAGRFARNLAVLYRNGVALLPALRLVQDLLGSRLAARATADMGRRIEAGETLSDALAAQRLYPPLLVRLVRVGERTGQLDATLEQAAAHYLDQVPKRVKRLLGLLEPALILGLVGLVGFIALAVYLPILSLLQKLR